MNKLEEIAKRCKASVSLTYRDRADYYEELKDIVELKGDGNGEYFHASEFLDGELEKCIETDQYWCLQFYPETPIGFHHAFSRDLDKLLDWALETLND